MQVKIIIDDVINLFSIFLHGSKFYLKYHDKIWIFKLLNENSIQLKFLWMFYFNKFVNISPDNDILTQSIYFLWTIRFLKRQRLYAFSAFTQFSVYTKKVYMFDFIYLFICIYLILPWVWYTLTTSADFYLIIDQVYEHNKLLHQTYIYKFSIKLFIIEFVFRVWFWRCFLIVKFNMEKCDERSYALIVLNIAKNSYSLIFSIIWIVFSTKMVFIIFIEIKKFRWENKFELTKMTSVIFLSHSKPLKWLKTSCIDCFVKLQIRFE